MCQYTKQSSRPLMAAFMDDGSDAVRSYPLLLSGVGLSLKTVWESARAILGEFKGSPLPAVTMNDFKTVLDFLDRECNLLAHPFNVWDFGIPKQPNYGTLSAERAREICEKLVRGVASIQPAPWMKLLGRATQVYRMLQKRGLMNGHLLTYPRYVLNTVSGRSKTLGFNVQGTDASYDVKHPDEEKSYFIHLDWISADLKAGQILSGDELLAEAFRKSDPYTVMAKGDLTRADCKGMMIRALYEMDQDSPALQFWPDLQKWVAVEKAKLENRGWTESVLGRRFRMATEGDPLHNMRSVFNASLQGTVVHAMHSALWQIYKAMPDCIVAEMHDSITLAANRHAIKEVLNVGVEAMLHPFKDVLDSNPTFPLRIYVGRHWKKWKLYKEIR